MIITSDTFRAKNITKDDGTTIFLNIKPSEYFVKPLLKEYIFNPSALTLKIAEEESETGKFFGTRVSFSCFGKVTSLNGVPQSDLVVEAIGGNEQNLHGEEATTGEDGTYRLRGLRPGLTYTVQLKNGENQFVDKAIPTTGFSIQMQESDYTGANFIVVSRDSAIDITGVIDTDLQFLEYLKIELYTEKNQQESLKTLAAGPTSFFQFENLPANHDYTIKLRPLSTFEKSGFAVDQSQNLKFSVNRPDQATNVHIRLPFSPKKLITETDQTEGSFMTLILLFVAAVGLLNYQKTMELYKKLALPKAENPPAPFNPFPNRKKSSNLLSKESK